MSNLESEIRRVLQYDYASFVELSRIEGFKGEYAIYNKFNMVLWDGVSHEAIEILDRMQELGEFHYEPASEMVYLIDGGMLNLPIAKRTRRYAKPHWLPVTLKRGAAKSRRK
jgi:hypothetical protein